MSDDQRLEAFGEGARVADRPELDDETFELVVIVLVAIGMVQFVVRLAVGDIVLGSDPETEQHFRRHFPLPRLDEDRPTRHMIGNPGAHAVKIGSADQVGLVENDQIGGGQLILEQLFQRAFVIEPFIRLALCVELVVVMGKAAGGDRRAVDHGDNAVDGHLRLDPGPVERCHQRLRQGQAGRLDDYVIGTVLARQQLLHGRDEVVGDRAADAAIV